MTQEKSMLRRIVIEMGEIDRFKVRGQQPKITPHPRDGCGNKCTVWMSFHLTKG